MKLFPRRSVALAIFAVLLAPSLSAAVASDLLPQTIAARYGLKRAWFTQATATYASGALSYLNLDRGTLLVQTRFNRVVALDPETGRTLWSAQVGPRNRAGTEPASDDRHVAVINGSTLYVLDRATGAELWHKQVGGTPGAGPALTSTHVFVPMINGLIEGYDLEKGIKQTPWVYKSAGRVLAPPMTTAGSVSWATEQGYFYVADPMAKGIRYRLETRDTIRARPAHWSPLLFAGSTDGYVYAVREAYGKIRWKFTVGDAIYTSPIAIQDKVYVVSEHAGMFCLDANSGSQLWIAPGVRQFLATSPTRVYGIDRVGRMAILDATTGGRLGSMPLAAGGIKISNNESDRIYVSTETGVVECFHEQALNTPLAYIPPEPEDPEADVKSKHPGSKGEESAKEPAESMTDESPDEAPAAMEDNADAPPADEDDPFK